MLIYTQYIHIFVRSITHASSESFAILITSASYHWGKPCAFPTSHRFNCIPRRCGRWGRIRKHRLYEGNLGRTQRVASWRSRSHLCWFTSLGALTPQRVMRITVYRTNDFVWENCADWRVLRYFACYPKMVWRKHIRPFTAVTKARWMRLGNSDPSLLPMISELTSNMFIGKCIGWSHPFVCRISHVLFQVVQSGCWKIYLNIQLTFFGATCLWMLLVSRLEKCRNTVIPYFFTLTSLLVTFQKSKDMPKTSALLFEGSWRIHVMIDAQLDEAKIRKKMSWDQKHAWMGQPWR